MLYSVAYTVSISLSLSILLFLSLLEESFFVYGLDGNL